MGVLSYGQLLRQSTVTSFDFCLRRDDLLLLLLLCTLGHLLTLACLLMILNTGGILHRFLLLQFKPFLIFPALLSLQVHITY